MQVHLLILCNMLLQLQTYEPECWYFMFVDYSTFLCPLPEMKKSFQIAWWCVQQGSLGLHVQVPGEPNVCLYQKALALQMNTQFLIQSEGCFVKSDLLNLFLLCCFRLK